MTPPHLTHPSLTVPHGFFGRRGGVSQKHWESLNCGYGSHDLGENVETNRALVRDLLSAKQLLTCRQIHSTKAVFATGTETRVPPKADGLVTTTPGLAIGALHADCTPVLFQADGVIGACHAGWRGAVAGITDSTVALMREHGAKNIHAVIGPTISLESYEVGDEFVQAIQDQDPKATDFISKNAPQSSRTALPIRDLPSQSHSANASPIAPLGGPGSGPGTDQGSVRPWIGNGLHFDLPGYVLARLHRLDIQVSNLDICTYANPDRYFSYRYNTHNSIADYGRNISAIVLPS